MQILNDVVHLVYLTSIFPSLFPVLLTCAAQLCVGLPGDSQQSAPALTVHLADVLKPSAITFILILLFRSGHRVDDRKLTGGHFYPAAETKF